LECKVIIGLGNPGPKYENTRHNIGFMALDVFLKAFCRQKEIKFQAKTRLNAEVCEFTLKGERLFLIKPLTFMNESGKAVVALKRRGILGANDNFLVVHDELDLPLGRIRFARRASSGGHNGVQSIIDSLGHNNFDRLRIGIGRPTDKKEIVNFVLKPFLPEEKKLVDKVLDICSEAIFCYLTQGMGRAMNKYNGLKIE